MPCKSHPASSIHTHIRVIFHELTCFVVCVTYNTNAASLCSLVSVYVIYVAYYLYLSLEFSYLLHEPRITDR